MLSGRRLGHEDSFDTWSFYPARANRFPRAFVGWESDEIATPVAYHVTPESLVAPTGVVAAPTGAGENVSPGSFVTPTASVVAAPNTVQALDAASPPNPPATGTSAPTVVSQFGTGIPVGEQTIHVIPYTEVGLSSLGTDFLNDLAESTSLLSYDPADPDVLKFRSPSLAGYRIGGDLHFKVGFGVDLKYNIDLGKFSTIATVTSGTTGNVDKYKEPAAGSGAAYATGANGRQDLFTNYVLDTVKTDIHIVTTGVTATEKSYVDLALNYGYDIGVAHLGVYKGGNLKYGFGENGNALYAHDTGTKSTRLFEVDPNQPITPITIYPGISGTYTAPRLPTLVAEAGGIGQDGTNGVYQPGSASGLGSPFATVTINPISLIPAIGQINEGSYYFLQNPLIDAGVEWKLITADFTLGLALKQNIDVSITNVDVAATVREKDGNGNYHSLTPVSGHYGDKLTLAFTPGIHFDTLIDETYTISAKIHSKIDLTPYLQLDIGLLHLAAIINPILVDELKIGFDLWSTHKTFEIASFNIIDNDNIVFTLAPVTVTTHVDTFLPVTGTPGDDTLNLPPMQDGVEGFAGDDIINGNDITNHIDGGDGDDTIDGTGGQPKDQGNFIHGGPGWDAIHGGLKNDVIYADAPGTGPGQEVLSGDNGNDSIHSNTANGRVYGNAGDDFLDVPVSERTTSSSSTAARGSTGSTSITARSRTG